jgi:putative flavoprotein involved in K+ transport
MNLRAQSDAAATRTRVAIIGAGPAGLAVAALLGRHGVDALVLDGASEVGESWRGHYDRLRLHTARWLSGLPGRPIPRAYGPWVSRDHFAQYLADYSRDHRLILRLGTRVERLDRRGDGWALTTTGKPYWADDVVVATGANRVPFVPPVLDGFRGELVHSSAYRNAAGYRGRDVLVIGAGNSGSEIATDLAQAGAGRVRIAIRTPPNIMPRDLAGLPLQPTALLMRPLSPRLADPIAATLSRLVHGDLTRYGLPAPTRGAFTQVVRDREVPIMDVGFVGELKRGQIEPVAAVSAAHGDELLLADGKRVRPDIVIAATGFRPGLESLVGHLDVLDDKGLPRVHGAATVATAPGLRFIGFIAPISGVLLEIARDAARVATAIARGKKRRSD